MGWTAGWLSVALFWLRSNEDRQSLCSQRQCRRRPRAYQVWTGNKWQDFFEVEHVLRFFFFFRDSE